MGDDLSQSGGFGSCRAWGAEAEDVRDDGLGVFAGFEGEAVDLRNEQGEQVLGERGGDEGVGLLRVGFELRGALEGDFDLGEGASELFFDLEA